LIDNISSPPETPPSLLFDNEWRGGSGLFFTLKTWHFRNGDFTFQFSIGRIGLSETSLPFFLVWGAYFLLCFGVFFLGPYEVSAFFGLYSFF